MHCIARGKGHPTSASAKQKLKTRSSAETKVVTAHDAPPQMLWTDDFIEDQDWDCKDTISHQDNESAMSMENNGKASCSKRTKHMNVKCFFVKDLVEKKEIRIQHLGTEDMTADFFSEPVQGKKFMQFRNKIVNIEQAFC